MFSMEHFYSLPLAQADAYFRKHIEAGETISAEALAHLIIQSGAAGDMDRFVQLAIDFENTLPTLILFFNDDPEAIDNIFQLILVSLEKKSDWEKHLEVSAFYADWLMGQQNFSQMILLYGLLHEKASLYKNQFLLRLLYKKSIDAVLTFLEQCNGSDKAQKVIRNITSAISLLFNYTDETDFFFESSERIRWIAQSYRGTVIFPAFRYYLVTFVHMGSGNPPHFSNASPSVKRKYENLKREFRQFLNLNPIEDLRMYEQKLERSLSQSLPSNPLLRQYTLLSQKLCAAETLEGIFQQDSLETTEDVASYYEALIEECLQTANAAKEERERVLPLSLAITTADLFFHLGIDVETALHDITRCRRDFDSLECLYSLTPTELTLMKRAAAAVGFIDFMQGDIPRSVKSLTRFLAIANQEARSFISSYGYHTFIHHLETDAEMYANSLSKLFAILKQHPEYAREIYENLYPLKNITYLYEHNHEIHKTLTHARYFTRYKTSLDGLLCKLSDECLLLDIYYAPTYAWLPSRSIADTKKDMLECHVFLLTRNSEITYIHLGSAEQVKKAVQAYEPRNYGSESYQQAEKFWRSHLSPFLNRQDKCRLLICPEGDLNNLSFGMLPCGDGIVLDKFTIWHLAHVEALSDIRQRGPIRIGVTIYQPDFGLSQNGKTEPVYPLSFTRREGETIVSTFDRSGIEPVFYLTGQEATASRVKKLIEDEKPDVIHFATHGVVDYDTQQVYILLANANQCRSIASNPAAPCYSLSQVSLSESDILDMDLSNTSLIFFSLCNAGLQSDRAVENLSGYIRAAMLAGAKTVIAPIGEVPDFCTYMISTLFYKMYLQHHFPPDLALQQAMLEVRKMTQGELFWVRDIIKGNPGPYPFSHPKWWAQWVCYSVEGG